MAEIHVYLENGFEHDLVTISVDNEEHTKSDVSTRYQVGLAALVELSGVELDAAGTAVVRIALPERGLAAGHDGRPGGHAIRPGGRHRRAAGRAPGLVAAEARLVPSPAV